MPDAPPANASDVPSERREFKYLLPTRLLPRLRELVAAPCAPDAHGGPDGTYLVRTLYYDTWDLRLYHANDREAPDRYKARVRTYPTRPGSPVFLEIKRRTLDIIRKTRVAVPAAGWQRFLALPPPELRAERARAELGRVVCLFHAHQLEPRVLVQYRREAWKSEIDPYARVSVDTRITCQRRERPDLDADERAWRPIDHRWITRTPEPVAVMELKYAGAPPRWMHDLVRHLGVIRYSFSKYANAVLAQAVLPSERVAWRSA